MENREPIDVERATSGVIFGGWLVDGEGGAGVMSSDGGLEGIFEDDEIGDKKVTTELRGGPNQKT